MHFVGGGEHGKDAPGGRVHGGFTKLGRVHLAQALEATDLNRLRLESVQSEAVLDRHQLAVIEGVLASGGFLALGRCVHPVEGRLGHMDVPLFDQFREVTEEQGQQQGGNVRPVDVGVGHDHDLVVAQAGEVRVVPQLMPLHPERDRDVVDFLVGVERVGVGFP